MERPARRNLFDDDSDEEEFDPSKNAAKEEENMVYNAPEPIAEQV